MTEQHNDINHWRRMCFAIKAYNDDLIDRLWAGQISNDRWEELNESSLERFIYCSQRIIDIKRKRVIPDYTYQIRHWQKMIVATGIYMGQLWGRAAAGEIAWESYDINYASAVSQLDRFYREIRKIEILFEKPPGITIHKSKLAQLCDSLPDSLQKPAKPSTSSSPQPSQS